MKTIVAGAALLALGISSATAADMAVKAPIKAVAPVFNWTGFYIGGFVGGAGADRDVLATEPVTAAGGFYNGTGAATGYRLDSSFIGGGTIGYNWQQPGTNWLLGLEGEVGYLHLHGSRQDVNATVAGLAAVDSVDSTKLGDYYGVIAARLGFTSTNWLFYGKGGVAFVAHSSSFTDNCIGAGAPGCGGGALVIGRSGTNVTYAAGAGIEYALNNNWSIKGEYLYLGTQKTYTATSAALGGVLYTNSATEPGIHTGKIGINYKFGGPIVAKY